MFARGLYLVAALLLAPAAHAFELIPAVMEHSFEFEWTPATLATHYEVVEEIYGFNHLPGPESLRAIQRTIVAAPGTFVEPAIGEMRRVRVRGMMGAASPSGDCPFEECGPWSLWSDEFVGRINTPDLDGNGGVGSSDFISFSRYWGQCVEGWRIRPCAE